MQFFVTTIASYSARANNVGIRFINVGGLLEGMDLYITLPKSLELKENAVNELPAWAAKNVWHGWNTDKLIKKLQRHAQENAPAGSKKIAREKIVAEFKAAEALNVELPPEAQVVTGEFVGEKGQTYVMELTLDRILSANSGVNLSIWHHTGTSWAHPTWEYVVYSFHTPEGNTVIFKSYSPNVHEKLEVNGVYTFKAHIQEHSVYRNRRQTTITINTHKDIIPHAE